MAQFRVYKENFAHGIELGIFDNLEDATACFESNKLNLDTAINLQTLDPVWGWVDETLMRFVTPGYDERVEDYWAALEAREVSYGGYGDAPGMSWKDFI